MLFGQRFDLVIVDQVVFLAHTILHRVEPLARLVGRGTVGQVATGIKAHAKDRVTGLQQRGKDTLVGLAARVRLDVGKAAAKQLTGALNRKIFRDINKLTPAIIAATGVALGILVGHHAALRFHHGGADDVFAGDQFDLFALASQFLANRLGDLRVAGCKRFGEKPFADKGLVSVVGHWATSIKSALRVISYRKPSLFERL